MFMPWLPRDWISALPAVPGKFLKLLLEPRLSKEQTIYALHGSTTPVKGKKRLSNFRFYPTGRIASARKRE